MNAIETHQLARRFGHTEALHGLDLRVPTGSVYALLGPNGAGKTTTIKLLMNLISPTAGHANVLGADSRRLGPEQLTQIGYVSENGQMPLWMSVGQLLDFCRPLYPAWDPDLEKALLARFALPVDRKLKHLSRGMLMKVALLSSLAYRPRLLVLDEPFTGLDPLVRDDLVNGLLESSSLGEWTVFVSSHDIGEVEQLCDHVALLNDGRCVLEEPVERLQSRFRRIEATLRASSEQMDAVPRAWLGFQREGNRATFVDTAYDSEETERLCRRHFPEAQITAIPMSLREIFVTVVRAAQARKGVAA